MPKNDQTGHWETHGGVVSHGGSGNIKVTQEKGGKKGRGFRKSTRCSVLECVEVALLVDGIMQ